MKPFLVPLAVFLILTLASCGPSATMVPDSTGQQSEDPAATPTPNSRGGSDEDAGTPESVNTSTPDPVMAEILLKVEADLAKRAHIDRNQIEPLMSLAVTWPDAGLGCPQPGKSYAQELSPGYLIELEANGKIYEYHTDGKADIILLCGQGGDDPFPVIPVTPGEIQDGEPWLPVD